MGLMDLPRLVSASMVLLASTAAFGFAPKQQLGFSTKAVAVGQKVIRPTLQPTSNQRFFQGNFGPAVRIEIDQLSGAVRLLTGANLSDANLSSESTRAEFIETALAFADQHRQALKVSRDQLQLVPDAVLMDNDVQFFKFRVLRNGIVIEDAVVDFRFKRGHLVQINNASFGEAVVTDASQGTPTAFTAMLQQSLGAQAVKARGERYRVVATKRGYQLIKVHVFGMRNGQEPYEAQVDGANGKVFQIKSERHYIDGHAAGTMYNRYYKDPSAALAYRDLTLVDAGDAAHNYLTDEHGNFNMTDGGSPKIAGLKGARITINPETGVALSQVGVKVNNNWEVLTKADPAAPIYDDKGIAQAMAYYHLNAVINHAKKWVSTPWFDKTLTANVNLDDVCNAYWDGSTVNFFSAGDSASNKCANTSLISDVMYHEWGHGLDANTGGIDDGAYSEGFGDAVSLTLTHSNILGIGFKRDTGAGVRDMSIPKIYPKDQGEVHAEGQIIGSTYWDLFLALKAKHGEAAAGELLSAFVLKPIFTASKYTDVYAAILIIDDNDGNPDNGTPNLCLINDAFVAHGLATAESACQLGSVRTYKIDDTDGNHNGVIEPGENVKIQPALFNNTGALLHGVTATATLTAPVAGIALTANSIAWDDITNGDTAFSRNALKLTVGDSVACGTSFQIDMALISTERSSKATNLFTVGKLTGSSKDYDAAGLPLAIKDNATVSTKMNVSGGQWDSSTKIHAANLKFDITHTYVGDLKVKLISPSGKSFAVYTGAGAGKDIHFNADISALVRDEAGKGEWQLEVSDSATDDVGTLDTVKLTMTPAAFECQ